MSQPLTPVQYIPFVCPTCQANQEFSIVTLNGNFDKKDTSIVPIFTKKFYCSKGHEFDSLKDP